jgi:hypothetical protein
MCVMWKYDLEPFGPVWKRMWIKINYFVESYHDHKWNFDGTLCCFLEFIYIDKGKGYGLCDRA